MDALLGRQTRDHGDLDVAVEAQHVDVLSGHGFEPVGEDGATAWNFLLAHPDGAVVDLHVITFDADGHGVPGPPEAGNAYPAGSLTGRGRLGHRSVNCVAPQWVVWFHDTHAGDANDRADVQALCARFGLDIPEQYR